MARNTGNKWTDFEHTILVDHASHGRSIDYIAQRLGRTPLAIRCRLENYGIPHPELKPKYDPSKEFGVNPYHKNPCAEIEMNPLPNPLELKEDKKMTNRTVTTKTFVGNRDASELSVEQLIDVIEQEQGFLERLKGLPTSAARTKLTEKHRGNLQALNELLEVAL